MDPVALAARGESVWHRLGLRAPAGLATEVAVRDAGGTEDLGPFGFVLQAREPWMLRPPRPLTAVAGPAGLVVAPCRTPGEVELFERTSVEAFTGGSTGWVSGTLHPPRASLSVPGLTLLLARLDGRPVGTAIAAHDTTVLNVGG